jgi:hypothetical protein
MLDGFLNNNNNNNSNNNNNINNEAEAKPFELYELAGHVKNAF